MTDRAKLLELAERVEAATGADRELDGLVFAHMNPDKRVIIGQKPGRFPQDPIYGGPLDIIWIDGFADVLGAPRYTASLDAAMSLAKDDERSELLNEAMESVSLNGWKDGEYLQELIRAFVAASLRAIAGSLPD